MSAALSDESTAGRALMRWCTTLTVVSVQAVGPGDRPLEVCAGTTPAASTQGRMRPV